MAAVIFPWTGGVEQLIVASYKFFPSLRIAPDPVGKSVFDCLLFLLCKGRLLFVQDSFLFPVGIFIRIIDTDIFQIECFLQNLIRIRPVCAVSDIGINVMDTGCAFPGNPPLCRSRREIDLNIPLQIKNPCISACLRPESLFLLLSYLAASSSLYISAIYEGPFHQSFVDSS